MNPGGLMKLYRVPYQNVDHGYQAEWCASKEAARRISARLRDEGEEPEDAEPIDVPTKKDELVRFLNHHAASLNG